MSFFQKMFGGGGEWSLEGVAAPWGTRPSIAAHIRAHVPPSGAGLLPGGTTLPDADPSPDKLRWAPGALDGVLGWHLAPGATPSAAPLIEALHAFLQRASDANARRLYDAAKTGHGRELADALTEAIPNSGLDPARLHAVARWLAEGAADTSAVIVGLVMLGLVRGGDDGDLLRTLARHEDFTPYALVALLRTQPSPLAELLAVGRAVTGWGRVEVVERLPEYADDEARAWLLREGFRNDVMWEYTALPAAETGGLLDALRIPAPDDALLAGARDILVTLIGRQGPGGTIAHYADGAEAAALYLRHLRDHPGDLEHVAGVATIRDFVDEPEGEARDPALGWPARADAIRDDADAFLARPEWAARIREGLSSDDQKTFDAAVRAADALKIDTWDAWFARVATGDDAWVGWWRLFATEDAERIAHAVAMAEARILLPDGTARTFDGGWLGPLDTVAGQLRDRPGVGWPLVRAALRSDGVRDRHMALQALDAWRRAGAWPDDADAELRAALPRAAGDADLEDRVRRVLDGRPLDDLI